MLGGLIRFYEQCVGISLPAIGRYKIELWWCPSGYKIIPHSHDNQDIELCFLFGHDTTFYRKKQEELFSDSYTPNWPKDIGKVFTISAGTIHWFEVSKWPLVFINFEKWKPGIKPTSASVDFKKEKQLWLVESV